MTSREKNMVGIAAAAVGALLIYALILFASRASSSSRRDSLDGLRDQVARKERLTGSLAAAAQKVSVGIPEKPGDDQVQEIVSAMETLAGPAGVVYTRFSPKPPSNARGRNPRRAGTKAGFDLSFTTTHAGLVGFFEAMEDKGLPYDVPKMNIKPDPKKPGGIEVTMELEFLLLEPMKGAAANEANS